MSAPALGFLLRYNSWATERLLEHCRTLGAAPLDLTTPGTYGSIASTLQHIVGSETYYLYRLTGQRPSRELRPEATYPLDELLALARENAARLERLAADEIDPERPLAPVGRSGPSTVGVVLSQLVHHAHEHRAQVASVLGAHGLPLPSVSGWAHGRELGVSG